MRDILRRDARWGALFFGLLILGVVGLGVVLWRLNNTAADDLPAPVPPTAGPPVVSQVTPTPARAAPTIAPYQDEAPRYIPTSFPPTATPPPAPRVDHINGVHIGHFLRLNPAIVDQVRIIYRRGQTQGRNPQAFAKLGDSTIAHPYFMADFDSGRYYLGAYDYLQPTIDYFRGSFGRESVAVRVGLHTWSVLDPMWSGGGCLGGEHILACEIRLHNPAFIFIRLGSNDAGAVAAVRRNLRLIVLYCIERGVVPVLGTKADRFEGAHDANNSIIREVAAEFNLPLLDYDLLAETLPNRGLAADRVHMTGFRPPDYTQSTAFQRGHSVHNLSALMTLEVLLKIVQGRPLPHLLTGGW
ncbi:MAG: hypothetical protein EA396_04900 [Anaerolineaceae bacterium]|nr:MAG: hypothetical protein EA396_04900 [Anaerolineaceae bacterium]